MRVFKRRFLHIAIALSAFLTGWLAPVGSHAADDFVLPRDSEVAVSMRPFIGVYEDKSGDVGIEEMRKLEQENPRVFQSPEQLRRAAHYPGAAWWLRTTIENNTGKTRSLVLLAGPPNLESVDFYVRQHGAWAHTRAGSLVPLLAQQDLTRYPTLRFSLAPQESVQVLMRIKSRAPFRLNPVLYSDRTFRTAEATTIASDGMMIGGMLALAWCAFLISIIMRRLPFLWLAAIAIAAALREAVARAYIQRLFWPLESTWGYRLEFTLDTVCLALFALFIHGVARSGAPPVPGARVYAPIAAALLACAVLAAAIPLSAATLLTLAAGIALAGSMLASALLLVRRARAAAGLLGLSALLVVLDIAVKTTISPLEAPLIPVSMILDSGTPFCALLIGGANFAVLALWAVHSLGKPWRERVAWRQAQIKEVSAAHSEIEPSSAPAASIEPAAAPSRTQDGPGARATAADAAHRQAMILSYVGHDLRAPLATISGYTRLLRQAAAPAQHAYLDVIELSVGYQFSLIEEILSYTKLELQPFDIAPEATRLPELMEELARFGIALCNHNGNSFEYRPAATLPAAVSVDRKRLRQAVLNLLGNAAKFTRDGMVRLEAHLHPGPAHAELHIQVFNDGPAIAVDDQRKIFSAFRQLRRGESGIGLGLFIVERIARGMGGDIRLQNSPDGGNRFSFVVPVGVVDATTVPTRPIRHAPSHAPSVGHLDAPPLSTRLALAKLARDGELSEIEKWVAETRLAYPRCAAFYEEVAACIENFDMERLQRMALLGIA